VKQLSRRHFAAATLAIAGLTLAACTSSPAPAPSDEGAPPEPMTLRVQTGPVLFEGLLIGIEEGYFEDEGLTIEHSFTSNATELIPQVINGGVEISSANGFSVMNAVMQGLPVKAIGGLSNAQPEPVVNGILVQPDSGIEGYEDLEGKKVGVVDLRDSWEVGTRESVELAGGDPSTIEFIRLPLPNLNEAVLSGQVDAVYNTGVFWDLGIQAGLVSIGSPVYEDLVGTPVGVWVASDTFIAEHPDVVERFNRAWARAVETANDDPDRVRQVRLDNTEADPDFVYRTPVVPFFAEIDEEGWQHAIEIADKHDMLDGPAPKVADLIAPGAPLK
jgi:NitT/TauT family transport system substrate-binding protein